MTKLLKRQGEIQEKLEAADAWELDSRMEMAMEALRCPPPETEVRVLSGGEKRRVALCRLLLQAPDILLLDEPTNHLDAETVGWLEQHLQQYPGTVITVTHDRYFLNNVAGWILELDRGRGVPWKGNYASWLEQKLKEITKDKDQKQSERARALQHELAWIRGEGAGAGRSGQTAEALGADKGGETRAQEITIPDGPRLGDTVIEAAQGRKAYDDHLLFDGLTFSVPPGAKVGIIGPNGAGKTTLFRMIIGTETPDEGTLTVGETVSLAHVEQSRETLDPSKAAWEEISGGEDPMKLGREEINPRAYAARFGFTGQDQQKRVGDLSGGERNRLHLGRILRQGANVILLDEPTNDLDVHTMRALEEGIAGFGGCVLVISHDRWFLNRITTHTLAFEGDSQARFFHGNYEAYEADRRKRLGTDPPRRIKYRRLTRT
jgi:ATP-binding cassette ChvD family protein